MANSNGSSETPKVRAVRVLEVGKLAFPQDKNAPYYASLDLDGSGKGHMVAMPATEFFKMLNSLIGPQEESCGKVHVRTVSVPA
jgi:hypothetical protein